MVMVFSRNEEYGRFVGKARCQIVGEDLQWYNMAANDCKKTNLIE